MLKNGVEVMSEAGVGRVHALGVVNVGFALGKETGNGKCHGDPVVPATVKGRRVERPSAVDFHAVIKLNDIRSHGFEVIDDGADTVGFLHSQFAGVADDRASGR